MRVEGMPMFRAETASQTENVHEVLQGVLLFEEMSEKVSLIGLIPQQRTLIGTYTSDWNLGEHKQTCISVWG